ncbi:uncharacterized protein FOMMEDRAFT_18335 [Fomitiporia mediterranea MF3/22]|uniref:uncharacterized protein n=1 Tax=Fomitiporia mediterranea (strain MF3/22) TaxID=694068 RepID=UPI000440911D|nr:uncharacterized protein FOMMEDRAFT_18335 [Fomitiporia mediterranea MF3/22]EJD06144.1 hypothetical protein FOMMEDRAFT_18335 [Fomitiporia mediterranea MF3/22]
MPSTTATTSIKKTTTSEHPKADSARTAETQEPSSVNKAQANESLSKEENQLKEYSKELYVYTLDLLNSVRIDNAHKGVNGKAYMLKRTISDIAVPLKTMAIVSGDAPKESKSAAAPA